MKDKKVLNISSEVVPYLPQSNQAINSFKIPKNINDHGGQTRIFMPRYGMINERRHQLHEVIRLSGMNLVINDNDEHNWNTRNGARREAAKRWTL